MSAPRKSLDYDKLFLNAQVWDECTSFKILFYEFHFKKLETDQQILAKPSDYQESIQVLERMPVANK